MEDLLGYVFSWILDIIIPDARRVLGNWGCFLTAVLVAGILVWFLPAYVLLGETDEWKAWLVVGPLATISLIVMISSTYGLARGPRSRTREQDSKNHPETQEAVDFGPLESSPQDVEALVQRRQDSQGTLSLAAEQHLGQAYAHEERGEFEDALSECIAALRFDPGYAEAYHLRGIVLDELGQTRGAMAAYRQAVRLDPAFSAAQENLAEVEAALARRSD